MLTTPHVLVGIYLASSFSPWLGLPAAFLSHFLFDFFYPHWNPHLFTEMKKEGRLSNNTLSIIFFDVLFAAAFTLYFAFQANSPRQSVIIFLSAFLAVLPDLVEIPFYFFKSKSPLIKKIVTFEHNHQARANFFWGTASQILVITICLFNLLR